MTKKPVRQFGLSIFARPSQGRVTGECSKICLTNNNLFQKVIFYRYFSTTVFQYLMLFVMNLLILTVL